jgi:hypothetical protein
MIVRSRGSANACVDVQCFDILLISSVTCRCAAENCSSRIQEICKLRFGIHLCVCTNCDCNRATLHETHAC